MTPDLVRMPMYPVLKAVYIKPVQNVHSASPNGKLIEKGLLINANTSLAVVIKLKWRAFVGKVKKDKNITDGFVLKSFHLEIIKTNPARNTCIDNVTNIVPFERAKGINLILPVPHSPSGKKHSENLELGRAPINEGEPAVAPSNKVHDIVMELPSQWGSDNAYNPPIFEAPLYSNCTGHSPDEPPTPDRKTRAINQEPTRPTKAKFNFNLLNEGEFPKVHVSMTHLLSKVKSTCLLKVSEFGPGYVQGYINGVKQGNFDSYIAGYIDCKDDHSIEVEDVENYREEEIRTGSYEPDYSVQRISGYAQGYLDGIRSGNQQGYALGYSVCDEVYSATENSGGKTFGIVNPSAYFQQGYNAYLDGYEVGYTECMADNSEYVVTHNYIGGDSGQRTYRDGYAAGYICCEDDIVAEMIKCVLNN